MRPSPSRRRWSTPSWTRGEAESGSRDRPELKSANLAEYGVMHEREGRGAVGEQRVVKALKREAIAQLVLGLTPQRQDLQLAQRVGEVSRVERASHRLLVSRRRVLMAVRHESLLRLFDRHPLHVNAHGSREPAVAEESAVEHREAVR